MFGRVSDSSDTTVQRRRARDRPGRPERHRWDPDRDRARRLRGVLDGFDAHPCGTWAPDGRWVAFAGTGEVWVVDTQTGAIRHLPDLRPSDLEWRPGTDELTIAGDVGTNRAAPTLSTPVTVYSVSTGELTPTRLCRGRTHHVVAGRHDLGVHRRRNRPDGNSGSSTATAPTSGCSSPISAGHLHGIGPVWSPTGDRIAYQRCEGGPDVRCSGERMRSSS